MSFHTFLAILDIHIEKIAQVWESNNNNKKLWAYNINIFHVVATHYLRNEAREVAFCNSLLFWITFYCFMCVWKKKKMKISSCDYEWCCIIFLLFFFFWNYVSLFLRSGKQWNFFISFLFCPLTTTTTTTVTSHYQQNQSLF